MFKEVFGHTFVELAKKIINTVDKEEENQAIVDDVKNNSNKIYEQVYSQFVIQPAHKRGDLIDAVKISIMIDKTINNIKKYFIGF